MKTLRVAIPAAAIMAIALVANVYAVETFTFDFTTDIVAGVAGLITAAAAMVAAVLAVALTVRLIPKGARLALKYINLIR